MVLALSPVLRIMSGPEAGTSFPLCDTKLTLGRDPGCDICLTAPDVSPHHAIIEETDGGLLIRDLDSSGGTFLNGNPISAELIQPGDTLAFGSVVAQYWVPAGVPGTDPDIERRDDTEEIQSSTSPFLHHSDRRGIQVALSGEQVSALFSPTSIEELDRETLTRAFRSLQALYEINQVLGTTFDVDTVLSRVLDIVLATVNGDRGVVLLTEPGSSGYPIRVSRVHPGLDRPEDEGELKISRTIAQHVLRTGEAVLTTDAAADDRFSAGDSVLSLQIRSAMCVPLPGRGEPIGILHVDAGHRNVFTEESLNLLACIADISGKVIENARLYHASLDAERMAAVGQTVAGTAHYMKNLLTGLMAGAELVDLGLETNDDDSVNAGWAPIRKNLDILSDLVLNMIDFSRERKPAFQPVDLPELINDLIELVRHRAEGRNIELVHEVSEEPPVLRADPVAIHRALLNLVTNAMDAIPSAQAGRVKIGTEAIDGFVILRIEDNGAGIPEHVLPHVFETFYTTKGAKGTGFGLAVTRKVIEEHGGRVEVETEEGQGTIFRIHLPV